MSCRTTATWQKLWAPILAEGPALEQPGCLSGGRQLGGVCGRPTLAVAEGKKDRRGTNGSGGWGWAHRPFRRPRAGIGADWVGGVALFGSVTFCLFEICLIL